MKHAFRWAGLAAAILPASAALAVSSVSYDFNGGAGGVGNTGFTNVYTETPAGYTLGGGNLTIKTLAGDTYGNYENDPDTAQNMFYSVVDPLGQTTLQAKISVSGLSANFEGGGVWLGTDQDHYTRLGIFHNSFLGGGPIGVELLRENQDRWGGATPPGQGDDIVSNGTGIGGTDPQTGSLNVLLRLVLTGNTVVGSYSLDNGTTYLPAGTFSGQALPGDPQGLGSNTEESPVNFKVGVYAFGGSGNASYAFDTFSATSVPEPGCIAGVVVMGGMLSARRRRV